jgi:hypothetical protein
MKRLRILVSWLLLLALTVGLLPTGALAATTLSLTSVSGKAGETVTVELWLYSDEVAGGNFNIVYDADGLTLVNAVCGENLGASSLNAQTAGQVRLSFASTQTLGDRVLVYLTFRITTDTSADGSQITLQNVRLYDEEEERITDYQTVLGTVTRQCAYFHLDCADTVEGQAARVEVTLDGGLLPAGGNFAVAYDPDVLTPTAVLSLDGLSGASLAYNLDESGVVSISFAKETAITGGRLCAIIFRAVGAAEENTAVTLTDVRAYDTDSAAMDTQVTGGTVQIVTPTESSPKLWVVGGALEDDGSAAVSILLQGRGVVCGGSFTLCFDDDADVTVEAASGVETNLDAGKLRVSWAEATPALGEITLVTLRFQNAEEGQLTFSDVRLYDARSDKQIASVDIRPGKLTAAERVTVVAETAAVTATASTSTVSVNVDLADVGYYADTQLESVTPVLALYESGKLKALAMATDVTLSDGIVETSLTAKASGTVTAYKVFVVEDTASMLPLCTSAGAEIQ